MATMRRPYAPPYVVTRSSAISEEKRRRLAELREEGLTAGIIAERLGLHRNTVYIWLDRLGLVPRRPCGCATRGRPKSPPCSSCEVRS